MSFTGRLMMAAENAFGQVWSVGELAVALSRVEECRSDPHRQDLRDDIARNGFYAPLPSGGKLRRHANGYVTAANPYVRVDGGPADRVVARFVPAASGSGRKLVIVCHCYGLPAPKIMERLFGLHKLSDTDVAYNIMNHHAMGTYPVWPGTGFVSGRLSRFMENLRSSITGLRSLTAALTAAKDYESVTVIGFSIGGQLAMHLANSAPVTNAILYCPVTSLHTTARELGLMRHLSAPLAGVLKTLKQEFSLEDLQVADPLNYDFKLPERDVHVIVQRYDALAPVSQVERIRTKHPGVRWHEFEGTHILPHGWGRFQRIIHEAVVGPEV
jgi:hypothetical protein